MQNTLEKSLLTFRGSKIIDFQNLIHELTGVCITGDILQQLEPGPIRGCCGEIVAAALEHQPAMSRG